MDIYLGFLTCKLLLASPSLLFVFLQCFAHCSGECPVNVTAQLKSVNWDPSQQYLWAARPFPTFVWDTDLGFDKAIWFAKASACNAGDPGSIPGSGKSPGEGNGNPLHYSCLENPKDKGAWGATVHGSQRVRHDWVTNTQTSNTRQVTINHPILQLPHLTTPTFF